MQSGSCLLTVAQAHMVHGYFVFTGSLWALCWQWIFLLAVAQPVKRHSWHDSQSLETLAFWQWHVKSDTKIHVAYIKADLKWNRVMLMNENDHRTICMK